jgi:RNA polymerase sigma factor (sigma-70 family)
MSPFDRQKPPAPHTFTTGAGVTVIVKPASPLEPARPPWAPEVPAPPSPWSSTPRAESGPSVVIRPRERRAQEGERDAFVRMLHTEYGRFIAMACFAQGDVKLESTKDLAQRVLITAAAQFDKYAGGESWPPQNLRGWLAKLVQNEALNHWRASQARAEVPADDDDAFFSPAPDPEGTAALAELLTRLSRYLKRIPQEEAEVFLCADVYGLTIEETATAVGRPQGTVAGQLSRARERLDEMARESNRATAAGERRATGEGRATSRDRRGSGPRGS